MSTGVDTGTQKVTFKYKFPLLSTEFNKQWRDFVQPGVIKGLTISKVDNATVNIDPGSFIVDDGVYTVRIEVTTPFSITGLNTTNRFLIARYFYTTTTNWFAQFMAVSPGNVLATDVVIGAVTYTGGNMDTTPDLAPQQKSNALKIQGFIDNLRVAQQPTPNLTVQILPGWVEAGGKRLQITSAITSPALVPPASSFRYNLIYMDPVTKSINVAQGDVNSNDRPTHAGRIPLAEIRLDAGQTQIYDYHIEDVRAWLSYVEGLGTHDHDGSNSQRILIDNLTGNKREALFSSDTPGASNKYATQADLRTVNNIAALKALDTAKQEVQLITFATQPVSGTWKIKYLSGITPAIQWNDVAATIQTMLQALPGLAGVLVSGNYTSGFTITFPTGDNYYLLESSGSTLEDSLEALVTINIVATAEGAPTQRRQSSLVAVQTIAPLISNKLYYFDPASTLAEDAVRYDVVQPTIGTGRWIKFDLDAHLSRIIKLSEHPTNKKRVRITAATRGLSDGSNVIAQINNLIIGFNGAEIDFATGNVYAADGTTVLGINFTPFTIPAGQYFRYTVTAVASAVGADNRIGLQMVVLAATAGDAVLANAPYPAFAKGINLGVVTVQESAGSIADILSSGISVLGSAGGGGGGSGTGDANSFLEDLKRRLDDSSFDWVTPNIFSQQAQTLIDAANSTGAYDIANSKYALATIGNSLRTTNLFGSAFLNTDRFSKQVELHTLWNLTGIDPLATYEVSRDNGVNFAPISMSRIGESNKYRGILVYPTESVLTTLQTSAVENTNYVFDATTNLSRAIKIESNSTQKREIRQVGIKVDKLGSPAGNLMFQLVKDDGTGKPSTATADIVSSGISVPCSSLAAGTQDLVVDLPDVVLLKSIDYWLVIQPDSAYVAGYTVANAVRLRGDSAGTVNNAVFNGTTWTAGVGASFNLVQGIVYGLIVRITSGTASVALDGIGVFYGESSVVSYNTNPSIERQDFSGNLDKYQFTLTRFLPEAAKLKVYDVNSGQVYRYPAFATDGYKVIFAPGTFIDPGKSIILIFDQETGSGFDNSDQNAALLAANGLGSTDPTIDRSAPGVGIKLKSPNGTKWHITVLDDGAILTTPM